MNLESRIISETSSELLKKFPELKANEIRLSIESTGNKLECFNYKFPDTFYKGKKNEARFTIIKKANEYGIPKTKDLDEP